jgi:predicted dehydrogenase
MGGFFKVHGAKGWIDADPAFNYDGLRLRAEYFTERGVPPTVLDEANPQKNPYQFTAQADHFSNCVQKNLEPKTPGEEGLRDLRYITEIYRTAGISML